MLEVFLHFVEYKESDELRTTSCGDAKVPPSFWFFKIAFHMPLSTDCFPEVNVDLPACEVANPDSVTGRHRGQWDFTHCDFSGQRHSFVPCLCRMRPRGPLHAQLENSVLELRFELEFIRKCFGRGTFKPCLAVDGFQRGLCPRPTGCVAHK